MWRLGVGSARSNSPTGRSDALSDPRGIIGAVNRTDRLYALVEELRAVSPRRRSARWLAERFEVSVRTVERDLSALQQAGLPIWADAGRTGGYAIDRTATLGPLGFTPDEALAVLVGLGTLRRGPFRQSATTALHKVLVAGRVHLLEPDADDGSPTAFAAALRADRVIRLVYRDRDGTESRRDVEPLGAVGRDGVWYLVGWCRLRDGVRAFRADRMVSVEPTDERPAPRDLRHEDLDIPFGTLRSVVDAAG